jgi:hypothetical protein
LGEILLVNFQNEWQPFGADGLPFLADSYDESMKLYKAQKPLLEKKLAEQGMLLLYSVAWPPQGIYSKKPLNSVADLKGIKWRAYSPTTARIAELIGAQPVTVQAAEFSQALATGVVEETPLLAYMPTGSACKTRSLVGPAAAEAGQNDPHLVSLLLRQPLVTVLVGCAISAISTLACPLSVSLSVAT